MTQPLEFRAAMDNEVHRVVPVRKVIYDGMLLMCVGFPILFLFLWGDPYQRGFFCYDESLRHPFHESTVPSFYLYIFGIGMPCLVMLATEFWTNVQDERKFYIVGYKLPIWVWNAYCVVGVYLFGAACSQLTTDVMKYTIGRLRPHFYTVCQPNINCSDPKNMYMYHEDFYCTNPAYTDTKRILKEMRLSFPSGHSSFSMYRMTRVSDYKHHWSDVLTGFLIGATSASLVARYVSTLFPNSFYTNINPDSTELSSFNMTNGRRATHQAV